MTTKIILIYLLAINIITFFVYGIDKWIAVRNAGSKSLHYSRPLSRGSKSFSTERKMKNPTRKK